MAEDQREKSLTMSQWMGKKTPQAKQSNFLKVDLLVFSDVHMNKQVGGRVSGVDEKWKMYVIILIGFSVNWIYQIHRLFANFPWTKQKNKQIFALILYGVRNLSM